MEILIYALPKGETRDYMECLLSTQCKSLQDIRKVRAQATAEGWHSIRIATYNGEAPDFVRTVSI